MEISKADQGAIVIAVANADWKAVEKLIESGIDINAKDEYGQTALIVIGMVLTG